MKTEMAMLPNGNYESVISPIQHRCYSKDRNWECVNYGSDKQNIHLIYEEDNPYEGGRSIKTIVIFCPFCGYTIDK